MSNHLSYSDATPEHETFTPLGELTIPTSYNELVTPGTAYQPEARKKELPDNGQLFVGMNSAAYTIVPEGKLAQIYTLGLAGCTGVAAAAKIENGTLAGVSHFDSMVDSHQRKEGMGPSEWFMNRFITVARTCGAQAIELSIKYAELHQDDENFGVLGENYEDWHFADQLESFAQEAEEDVKVSIEAYADSFMSHTLAVNVGRNALSHIAFL